MALSSTVPPITSFISDATDLLQKVIEPTIQELLPEQVIFLNALETNSGVTPMANNSFYVTVRSQRHSGVASVREGNQIVPGKPTWDQAVVSAKFVSGSFEITDQLLQSVKGNPGALEDYMTAQVEPLRKDFAREMNRAFYFGIGDYGTGFNANVLAQLTITATGSYTHIGGGGASGTLTNWAGLNSTGAEVVLQPTEFIGPNMLLGFIPASAWPNGWNVTPQTGVVSATTAVTNTTFTLNSAVSLSAATGAWYIVHVDGDGLLADEPSGLRFLIDDGVTSDITTAPAVGTASAEGISRSQVYWKGNVFTPTNGSATLQSDMTTAYITTHKYGNVKFILTNYKLYQGYGNSLLGLKKTYSLDEDLLIGWTGFEFAAGDGKVGVLLDYMCPDETIFGMDPGSMTLAELTPMSWVDMGNNNILRITNYLAWQGVLRWYLNLAVKDPRANFKMVTMTTAS